MWYFTNPPKCFCNQAKITPLWQFLALCKWWGHTWTKCTQRQGFFTFFLILLGPLEATGEVLSWGLWLWEWMDWQSKGRKRGKENCLERRGGRGGSRGLGDEREKKGGGEYHPLSQLWRGSGGWAAHRKQLWLHPRPHTKQPWATQSSTDRPTKWPGCSTDRDLFIFRPLVVGGKLFSASCLLELWFVMCQRSLVENVYT